MDQKIILVTGATGYVGARLVPRLIEAGYRVRAVGRSLAKLKSRAWALDERVELMAFDILDEQALSKALEGVYAAYYLVHSMNAHNKDFAATDRDAAELMTRLSAQAGIERIVYLGGLGQESADLSKHLKSRAEVSEILQAGKVPVTTLRAGMVLSSGSTSFEILRYLVERLPLMVTPRWVSTISQPIAIRNVLTYLIECLRVPECANRVLDIGGPDIMPYQRLMEIYAEEAKLPKRWIMPVPVFTPRISSYWIHFITPVPSYIARPLAEGLRNPVVCQNDDIKTLIPQTLLDCRTAIKIALDCIAQQKVESRWTDAGIMQPAEWLSPGDPGWAGGTFYEDNRVIDVTDSVDAVWYRLTRLGGKTGWYYGNWLWKLRGFLDKLIGGVGLSRGRRSDYELYAGDALDFWRVVEIEKGKKLFLLAEMKLPGEAILEFFIKEVDGHTQVQQVARFLPHGLLGLLYWWAVSPLHEFVFNGMLRGIAAASRENIIDGPRRAKKLPQTKSRLKLRAKSDLIKESKSPL